MNDRAREAGDDAVLRSATGATGGRTADPAFGDAVERLQGHGVIRHGAVVVGESDYDLIVTPPQLRGTGVTYEAGMSDDEPRNAPDIAGRLMGPLFQAQPFAEDVHTLVLADGREFEFRVLQPDTNEIIGVTWFRAPSAPR